MKKPYILHSLLIPLFYLNTLGNSLRIRKMCDDFLFPQKKFSRFQDPWESRPFLTYLEKKKKEVGQMVKPGNRTTSKKFSQCRTSRSMMEGKKQFLIGSWKKEEMLSVKYWFLKIILPPSHVLNCYINWSYRIWFKSHIYLCTCVYLYFVLKNFHDFLLSILKVEDDYVEVPILLQKMANSASST